MNEFSKTKLKDLKYIIPGTEKKTMGRELVFYGLGFPTLIILWAIVAACINPGRHGTDLMLLLIFFCLALIAGINLFKSIL